MPTPEQILANLTLLTNAHPGLALAFHVAVLGLLVLEGLGVRIPRRVLAALCALPAASVSVLAFGSGNPFNGGVFLALTLGLLLLARGAARAERAPHVARWLAAPMLLFALLYPHFVAGSGAWLDSLRAPLGLIPCPTLALIVAVGLYEGAFGSRRWAFSVGACALFYGLFGVLRLEVWLDLGLLVGAVALLVQGALLAAPREEVGADRARIDAFLALHRIALVGASHDPAHFSRAVWKELAATGHEVVPVHPSGAEIAGQPVFRSLAEITPAVEGVLVMTPAAASEQVVREAAELGIRSVWLHRGAGTGAVSEAAVALARQRGLELVAGYCPLMFVHGAPRGVHAWHAALLRLTGRFPAAQ